MAGVAANWMDSSARISSIEDARAVPYTDGSTGDTLYHSYSFTYTTGGNGLSYLSSITSYVGTPESYTFSISQGQPLYSPSGASFSTASSLTGITFSGLGYSYGFTYDTTLRDGDLTQVQFPQGGHLRWAYQSSTYAGPQTIREVQYRYLQGKTSGGEDTYTFTPGNGSSTTLDDPTGAERYWVFSGGWLSEVQYRASAGAAHPLRHEYYNWVQDPTSLNYYVGKVKTVLDDGQTYAQTSQTVQTQDAYGNVMTTQSPITVTCTTARAYTNTYKHTSDTNYSSRYILTGCDEHTDQRDAQRGAGIERLRSAGTGSAFHQQPAARMGLQLRDVIRLSGQRHADQHSGQEGEHRLRRHGHGVFAERQQRPFRERQDLH